MDITCLHSQRRWKLLSRQTHSHAHADTLKYRHTCQVGVESGSPNLLIA